MTPPAEPARYKNHRFPGEIISHGVWLYSYGQNIRTHLSIGGYASTIVRPLACLLLPSHSYSASKGIAKPEGETMDWKHLLAHITETVDQELLLRNEYLVTENRRHRSPRRHLV